MPDLRFEAIAMGEQDPFAHQAVDIVYDSLTSFSRPSTFAASVRPLLTYNTQFYGLIALPDDLVAVGSLFPSLETAGEVHLSEFAVAEPYRGQGLGRMMLTELERVTQEDYRAAGLSLYPEGDSRDFYKHLGYEDHPTEPLHLVKRFDRR